MLNGFKKIVAPALLFSGFYCASASASLWQSANMGFENDRSHWGVYAAGSGGGTNNSNVARTGSKGGFLYAFTKWTGLGRNVVIPAFTIRNYYSCAARIYAKGGRSYFEVIDTSTWTYLRPLAHVKASTSYRNTLSGSWRPPRKDVYLRHVANAGLIGEFTHAYIDDALMQCLY